MIVSFDGSLISAELVYKITAIKEAYEINHHRTGCYDYDHRKPFFFVFKIIFLNGEMEVFKESANYKPEEILTKEEFDTQRSNELAIKCGDIYRQSEAYQEQRRKIEEIYECVVENIELDKLKTIRNITDKS